MTDSFFDLRTEHIDTKNGSREALILTPAKAIVAGQSRLRELRAKRFGYESMSAFDVELVERVHQLNPVPQVIVFRQKNADNTHYWRMHERLSAPDRLEMGCLLMRDHLALYRGLMEIGVILFIYADWSGPAYEALRSGLKSVRAELNRIPHPTPLDRLNYWILRNLVFFFSARTETMLKRVLPDQLSMIESRIPRMNSRLKEARVFEEN